MKSFIEKVFQLMLQKQNNYKYFKIFNSPKYLIVIMGLKNINFINSPKTPKHIPLK